MIKIYFAVELPDGVTNKKDREAIGLREIAAGNYEVVDKATNFVAGRVDYDGDVGICGVYTTREEALDGLREEVIDRIHDIINESDPVAEIDYIRGLREDLEGVSTWTLHDIEEWWEYDCFIIEVRNK